jgi:hypothetical protein
VKQSLIDAGFLINEEKSVFDPVQCLGIIWNSTEFCLQISDRRISDLISNFSFK